MSHFQLLKPQALLSEHQLSRPASFGCVGMGIGKTGATLWSLSTLLLTGEIDRALVVAPLRVAVLTWPHEIAKWEVFADVPFHVLRSPEGWAALQRGERGIYLINYEALPKLTTWAAGNPWPFDTVVFDESTKAKNPSSKRINLFRPYLKGTRHRWALTGTPSPESLFDLFAQVRLLDDGALLGPCEHAFRHRYFYLPNPYAKYDWRAFPHTLGELQHRLRDLAIVLESKDWLEVTPTETVDIEVTLPPEARKAYREMEVAFLTEIKKRRVEALSMAVQMGKLCQMAGGAVYTQAGEDEVAVLGYLPPRETVVLHHAKVAALQALLQRHKGEPVLIACNYRHEQDRLEALGIVRWDRATTDKRQTELLEKWNAGRVPALCADPRSIGHGMNLQAGGRIVVWFSPTWSGEGYDQFNARLARRGQGKDPLVYRLVSTDTVDEAVLGALEEKGDGQNTLLKAIKNLQELRA